MGIFWSKKSKEKLVLVFHIGSSSVGGALFSVQDSGVPKIILSINEEIDLQNTFNIDEFLSTTLESLEILVEKIHKAGMGVPKMTFCILSSPWYVSQTRVIRLEKNAPFIFTSKLALDLIQKEISLFEEEYLAKYRDAKSPVKVIEFKNIKTVLNGYETSSPLDQKIRELEMTIFISISGEQVLQKIEKIITRHFHLAEIKFSSFIMTAFAVVRDIYAYNTDFLLIDIGGVVTDISMIKKNILHESISFPLGLNFMIRGVASALHCSLSQARSLVSLLKDGHATESATKKIGSVVDRLKTEWLHKFQESLSNLSHDISIPSTIYLAVNKEMANFFTETIKNEQFNQYTLTESKFQVIFLDTKVFHGMANFEDNVVRDSNLIIDSIYINRFLINSNLTPLSGAGV